MAKATAAPPAIPMPGPGRAARWNRRSGRFARARIVLIGLAVVAVLLALTHQVLGRIAPGNSYSVSVPVELRPYDPQLWSMVNAESFEAAQALDAAEAAYLTAAGWMRAELLYASSVTALMGWREPPGRRDRTLEQNHALNSEKQHVRLAAERAPW